MVYRDRYGNRIKPGDVVVQAITLNQGHFCGFSFSTKICKKVGGRLILDGVYSWGYLSDQNRNELVKLTINTDLRKVEADFLFDFRKDD